jgi:hypothetical protein
MNSRLTTGFMGPLRRALWVALYMLPWLTRTVLRHRIAHVVANPSEFAESSEIVYAEMQALVGRNTPAVAGAAQDVARVTARGLFVHRFANAEVIHNSRFNSVIVDNTVVLPTRTEKGPWALYKGKRPRVVGLINGQSQDLVAIQFVVPVERYRAALFIGTRAPYNWYHWLANLLPALHVANGGNISEDVPLLLPEEVTHTPQMLQSLGLFLGDRPVALLRRDTLVRVDHLFWADSPVDDGPFAQPHENRNPLTLHPRAMADFRDHVLQVLGSRRRSRGATSRIFLSRRATSARSYNGEVVELWAKEYGFETVLLEELSFSEQVVLFHSATHLIGPTGAAFTNVLFAQPSLRALRLHGGANGFENYFANLATVSGCAIYDLECEPTLEGGFRVNEQSFRAAVRFLLDDSTTRRNR